MKIVNIVIPIYKTNLDDFEVKSLKQFLLVLGNYPTTLVIPEHLEVTEFLKTYQLEQCTIERFDNTYFSSVFGYNKLMLMEAFYARFEAYKYILIYQLDAYVFRDELLDWCSKDYDYIGAPWIATPNRGFKKLVSLFDSKKKKARSSIFYKVGNGGFSLRKVSSHIANSKKMKPVIEQNLKRSKDDFRIMEDVFWSSIPEQDSRFLIPDYKEGLQFAFDRKPDLAYKLNNNKLPFGCHGFEKPKVKVFWEKMMS
tara:strand:- start:93 stop:854 length:762 start_codon:yes stop_codon:yes gene_type:complete